VTWREGHDAGGGGRAGCSRPRRAPAAERLAGRWARNATVDGAALGLGTGVLLDAVGRQAAAERSPSSLLAVTEPTESATAAAFAHTAVLAGRPDNAVPLAEAGRLFGRLAHLLDAVEDLPADLAAGAWNPLAETGTDLATARRLADDATLGGGGGGGGGDDGCGSCCDGCSGCDCDCCDCDC
jgi:hypothetical protein